MAENKITKSEVINYKLESLRIDYQDWGEFIGQYKGSVKFSNGKKEYEKQGYKIELEGY